MGNNKSGNGDKFLRLKKGLCLVLLRGWRRDFWSVGKEALLAVVMGGWERTLKDKGTHRLELQMQRSLTRWLFHMPFFHVAFTQI